MDLEAFFHEYKEKKNAYQMALSTMYYDQATIAPKNGIPYRNRMSAILSGEAFDQMANKESIEKIEELAKQENVSAERKKELQLLLRELNDLRVLPREVYVEYSKTIAAVSYTHLRLHRAVMRLNRCRRLFYLILIFQLCP